MALQWHEFASKDQLDAALAAHIAERLSAAINARGAASLAVSGGRTPAGMFAALSQAQIDWRRVNVTLVDERWVQPDHADSNEKSVRTHLLQGPAAKANFISLVNGAATPHEALPAIEARLAIFPTPIDVLILGMGDDGHTASLFPDAAELEAACASTALLAAVTPPVAPHQRITLTLPTIARARDVIVHVTGEGKKSLLLTAMSEDKPVQQQYPIRRVLDQVATAKSVFWTA
ncbi:6-phosphogluconolactonase [Jeongeupia sp. USM3]|uniref:6-phosphogluconolactonase n=1 Tax=Jeongeupia sp. USM3 TaxID=1906741 RepID=UPI00089DF3FE|nr:6-phosphogluconolactonase [Jeongeupia sp. USM3]AOY01868.1 6-phosphogluconolactonase [Jeongeupia sp. USM3]